MPLNQRYAKKSQPSDQDPREYQETHEVQATGATTPVVNPPPRTLTTTDILKNPFGSILNEAELRRGQEAVEELTGSPVLGRGYQMLLETGTSPLGMLLSAIGVGAGAKRLIKGKPGPEPGPGPGPSGPPTLNATNNPARPPLPPAASGYIKPTTTMADDALSMTLPIRKPVGVPGGRLSTTKVPPVPPVNQTLDDALNQMRQGVVSTSATGTIPVSRIESLNQIIDDALRGVTPAAPKPKMRDLSAELSAGERAGIEKLSQLPGVRSGAKLNPGGHGTYQEPVGASLAKEVKDAAAPATLYKNRQTATVNLAGKNVEQLFAEDKYDEAASEISRTLSAFFGGKERGAISTRAQLRAGSGAIGAVVGGTQGETPEERAKNAALGAATGAFVVPAIARLAASTAPKALQSVIYTSTLSSPASVLKAWLGAYGGAVAAAAENPKMAPTIIRHLMPDKFTPRFLSAFKQSAAGGQQLGQQAPNILKRIYGAADEAARAAMQAGGISAADAPRFTLSGDPTSKSGKFVLDTFARADQVGPGLGMTVKTLTTLFPRVGIQILERGAERMGGGLVAPSLRTGGSQGIKTALGAGAVAAGYAAEDDLPTWLQPFAAAAAGPYALPVMTGMAASRGMRKGGGAEGAKAAATEIAGQIPLGRFGSYEAGRRVLSGATLVPNLVQDIAEYRDPYDRQPEGFFGSTKAKIPGLRETLPVRGERVNIAGQPTDGSRSQSPIKRALTPRSREVEPLRGIPSDVATELRRLDISINPPSFEKEIKFGSKTVAVPPALAEKRRAEAREKLVPVIQKTLASRRYQSLSDEKKKILLARVVQQAQASGAAKARGTLLRELKQRGDF